MACRLHGNNPLSEPVVTYCQLGHKERILMKLITFDAFSVSTRDTFKIGFDLLFFLEITNLCETNKHTDLSWR